MQYSMNSGGLAPYEQLGEAQRGVSSIGRERLLSLSGLSVWFREGMGDELTWQDDTGASRTALDLVGGAGALLLGHNHPRMVEVATAHFRTRCPMLVQAARREPAERLKRRLAELLKKETGTLYSVMLLSTGSEAVEAALKHARLELLLRQRAVESQVASRLRQLERRLREGSWQLTERLLRDCERLLGVPRLGGFDDLCQAVRFKNLRALQHPGHLFAVEGGFHGKTLGSLAVTWNPEARLPFVRGEPLVRFLRPGDVLSAIAEELSEPVFEVHLEPPFIRSTQLCTTIAVVAEPIRGEGGVYELEPELIREIRALRERFPEIPLIADEIQCGLGRTGRFVEAHALGLVADYLVFGKALGGGVTKLSAVAIAQHRYRPEYSLLHTSTFGDDELSAGVGVAFLDQVENDGLVQRAAQLGGRFEAALGGLLNQWPGQIREIRGRGLMFGVEFHAQSENPSAVIRALDEEQLLSLVIAGHLLHRWDIRILPTFGRRRVLRIEPSAYFDPAQIERVVTALSDVCAILALGDAYALLRYLVDADKNGEWLPTRTGVTSTEHSAPAVYPLRSRVAFIGHLVEVSTLASWDPSLGRFSERQLGHLTELLKGLLPPRVITTRCERSATGAMAELSLIGIAMTAEQIESDLRSNRGEGVRAQVFAAYELARELGCSLVGFGGYTSIATMNCVEFVEHGPGVTTGNALTVGLAFEAMRMGIQEIGLSLATARAAICGGTGNIGQVYASLLAGQVGSLTLVGRAGSHKRLRSVARRVVRELAQQARDGRVGGALFDRFARAYVRLGSPPIETRELLELVEAELRTPLLELSEDLGVLEEVEVIVTASNSARPILQPKHISKHRPVLICDAAVPADVSPEVAQQRPQALVIRGGVAALPNDAKWSLPGFVLGPGETYACVAETLLLGLAGISADFSRGALTTDQVREVIELARLHGFRLGSYNCKGSERAMRRPVVERPMGGTFEQQAQ